MVHICPPVYYLLSSFVIFKINRIKFFQEFKEETPLFQKSKTVAWLRLPREMRSLFLWGGYFFRRPLRGLGPTGRRLDFEQKS